MPKRGFGRTSTNDLTSEHSTPERSAPAAFVTTQWTRVLEARGDSPEARAALSDLCAAYYAPVFAFIRHNTPDEDAARDRTQEFFTRLLSRQSLGAVDPERVVRLPDCWLPFC